MASGAGLRLDAKRRVMPLPGEEIGAAGSVAGRLEASGNEVKFPFKTEASRRPQAGLIALQSDETVEAELRSILPGALDLMVARVPMGERKARAALGALKSELAAAAGLFPRSARFSVVGFASTSGAAEIGTDRIAALVGEGCLTRSVTEPVSALVAAAKALGVRRIALLSPYPEGVNDQLRVALNSSGLETPRFGSFDMADEAKVARIDAASIKSAAAQLVRGSDLEALFISSTNLRALRVVKPLEAELGIPVLTSNLILAWNMTQRADMAPPDTAPGRLFDISSRRAP